jgi:hypothetical protein
VVILVTVPRLDTETRASHEMQPSNRARQMVEVAGGVIPILAALGRKGKDRSCIVILAWIAIPRQPPGAR